MTTRILLLDDRVMLRQGLRMLIETQTDLQVVGEADTASETVALVAGLQPDVIVFELGGAASSAIAAMQVLHDHYPAVRLVVLCDDEDDAALVPAVRAGAIGVVSTATPVDALLSTIRAAAAGRVSISAAVSVRLVQELRAPVEPTERLTEREFEVLECVTQGLANKEIAWRLRISEKTVKSHVSTILSKFGVVSRTQAALHATRSGLVSAAGPGCSTPERPRGNTMISLADRRHRSPMRAAS